MNSSYRQRWRGHAALSSALLTLFAVGTIAWRGIVSSRESQNDVEHTHQVLAILQTLTSAIETFESNFRGYIITGNESYLGTYRAQTAVARQDAEDFGRLTVDNPREQALMPGLKTLLAQKIQFSDTVIAIRRVSGLDAAANTIPLDLGRGILGGLQENLDALAAEEHRLLTKRENETNRRVRSTKILVVLISCLGLLAAVPTGWGAIRDDQRRARAEEAARLLRLEELARSNIELEKFAYIASHDLQEPLRMVASYTQLLSKRYKGKLDADADEFIAYAVDGATRMQRLIRDLLTYSSIGTLGKELIRTSAQDMLDQALSNLRGTIEDSGAIVTHDYLPSVMADETQLVQLFQNLIGNGIKYQNKSASPPRIHISAARNGGGRWLFSVKDNGLGINPQYFDRIFEMFQRLHKREEFAGTGIGLAICKRIAERHGSSISVESQPGRGSTFYFALTGK